MHTPEEQPRGGGDLQQEIEIENVTPVREVRLELTFQFALRHPDISTPIPLGTVYVRAPSGRIWETVEAYLPELIRDLEAGVSEEGRAALSPRSVGGPVSGASMVIPRVVRRRRVRR